MIGECPRGFSFPSMCDGPKAIAENLGWIESRHGYNALIRCEECGRTYEKYVAAPSLEAHKQVTSEKP